MGSLIPKSTKYEDVFSDRVYKTAEQLSQRPEYLALIEPYKKKGADLSDKEKTELWRIEFANYNIYKVDRWRLVKGGKAYYKKEAAIMGKADIWNFDCRDLLARHGKVTYIQGDKDFLDLDAATIRELTSPEGVEITILPSVTTP